MPTLSWSTARTASSRVLAARKLNMVQVPCIELAHLTPAQRRAYIIADNKLALNAGWDEELLTIELGELKLRSAHRSGSSDRQRPSRSPDVLLEPIAVFSPRF